MSEGVVLTSIDSRGIAEVILNRPERNNAYNGTMIDELIKSFTSLYNNDDVRVVLIRGNGKHFQGGADLEWLKEIGKLNKEENIEVSRKTASAIKGLTEFPKPTIAMIHGGCFGGGTGIAAAADIVVAIYGEDPYAEFQGDRENLDYISKGFDTNNLLKYK